MSRAPNRVLYFECYRSRIDRPQRVQVLASPFPRVLTERELAHRRRMLAHLSGSFSKGQQAAPYTR
jgi:hypothetical protein